MTKVDDFLKELEGPASVFVRGYRNRQMVQRLKAEGKVGFMAFAEVDHRTNRSHEVYHVWLIKA